MPMTLICSFFSSLLKNQRQLVRSHGDLESERCVSSVPSGREGEREQGAEERACLCLCVSPLFSLDE